MKILKLLILVVFIIIESSCQSTELPPSTSTMTNPGLLLTTADTISFIYPKEMNYEKDYLQVVLKIVNTTTTNRYRIEDSVYDNKTWSIYFILSNWDDSKSSNNSSNTIRGSGSSLIRLKQQHRRLKQPSLAATLVKILYQLLIRKSDF